MQVASRMAVSIAYTLTDDDGTVLDTSEGGEPLTYIHGAGSIVRGLEAALDGRAPGDHVVVTVEPSDGYGDHDPDLIQAVDREQLPPDADVTIGMQFHADGPDGPEVVTVVGVEGQEVTLDANHPLAGITLHFDVTVVSVRVATDEELEHGHVHGPGDDHHH